MKKKRKSRATSFELRVTGLLVGILVLLFLVTGCRREQVATDTYTCPMHPTVVAERPGVCPVCGMDLVRKARPGEEVKITDDLQALTASPGGSVMSGIKTLRVEYRSAMAPLKVSGLVTYDPRMTHVVTARAAGRLEAVYVTAPLQRVHKGEKIAVLYSPELAAASQELIYLETRDAGNTELVQSARRRIELLGLTSGQINELVQRKETTGTYTIYSPYEGYAVLPAVGEPKPVMPGGTADMGNAPAASKETGGIELGAGNLLREGDYVSAGQTLLALADTDALRVELEVPGSYASYIHANDTISLDLGKGSMTAPVELVQPFFAPGENLLRVRVRIKAAHTLAVGQMVAATLQLRSDESYWVPRAAVVDLGLRTVVFVKQQGVFKPRKVLTGTVASDWVQVLSGLTSQDEIAAQAGYLVDSESFIQTSF